jgi:hypothetical protein
VPPAFSDATSWTIGDLTDHVIADVYVDHGNLVDYLGGDATTTYGARREADGFARWDLEFEAIDFELGNEPWGTPDDRWDMDPNGGEPLLQQMQNYATYCERRIGEMKGRPGWRATMRVGFAGRSPDIWLGGWPGSYDGTLVPAIGAITDFSTVDLYYGNGAATDPGATIYRSLLANAQLQGRQIAAMKAAFAQANGGVDIATAVYEGNATWGPYEPDLTNPSPLYFKQVSLGAAVSLVDVYAAANRAGVTVINHFHFGGNIWGATGPYPAVLRKPAFFALQLLTHYARGALVGCTVSGAGSFDDPLTGEQAVPTVACYPYLDGEIYQIVIVNRDLAAAPSLRIPHRLAPFEAVTLGGADPSTTNETAETVTLTTETLAGALVDELLLTVPPVTAVVLVAGKTATPPPDGGGGGLILGVVVVVMRVGRRRPARVAASSRGNPAGFARRVPAREGMGTLPGFPPQAGRRASSCRRACSSRSALTLRPISSGPETSCAASSNWPVRQVRTSYARSREGRSGGASATSTLTSAPSRTKRLAVTSPTMSRTPVLRSTSRKLRSEPTETCSRSPRSALQATAGRW